MLADYLIVTENVDEMVAIAHRLVEDVNKVRHIYTPLMKEKMREEVLHYLGEEEKSETEIERIIWRCVYDFWVYGCTVDEEFYLNLLGRTDKEKREFILNQFRHIYVEHLNWDAGPERIQRLEDKFRLYKELKQFYKRDIIEVSDISDLDTFTEFVSKHYEFVVKPADYSFGVGIHKVSMKDYADDPRLALQSILNEGIQLKERHPSRVSKMVLEELIVQDKAMAAFHPGSVNVIRATAVKDKDGQICVYRPWIKVGISGNFLANAVTGGFDAEVDSATGVVITDGYQENGNVFTIHPDTGIQIKGFKVPQWQELLQFVDELMAKLPEYGYIGWDLALTPDGWSVVEGNYSGEMIFQMIDQRGCREDFEKLIGWKCEKVFWWQGSKNYGNL